MAVFAAAAISSRRSAWGRAPFSWDAPTRGRLAPRAAPALHAPSTFFEPISCVRCGSSAARRSAILIVLISRCGQGLRLHHRSIEPDDVVPAQDAFGAVEQPGVASAGSLERKLLHAVRRICRHVAQDV